MSTLPSIPLFQAASGFLTAYLEAGISWHPKRKLPEDLKIKDFEDQRL